MPRVPGSASESRADLTEIELLQLVARSWRRASTVDAASRGLSPHQERALLTLARLAWRESDGEGECAPGIRVSALAERLHIAPRSATEVADALEAAGLLARSPDPSDRRAVLLSLTDRGREIVDEAVRSRREAAERAMSQLSTADRAELRRLLEALLVDFPT